MLAGTPAPHFLGFPSQGEGHTSETPVGSRKDKEWKEKVHGLVFLELTPFPLLTSVALAGTMDYVTYHPPLQRSLGSCIFLAESLAKPNKTRIPSTGRNGVGRRCG